MVLWHGARRGIRECVDDAVECAVLVAAGARAEFRCACQSEGPVDRGGSPAVGAARRRGSTLLRGTGRAPCGLVVRRSEREPRRSRLRGAARRRPGSAPTFVGLASGPIGRVGRASPAWRGQRSPPTAIVQRHRSRGMPWVSGIAISASARYHSAHAVSSSSARWIAATAHDASERAEPKCPGGLAACPRISWDS